MANLIRFALGQRLLMMLLVVLLSGGGYWAFKNIPIDAFPEVSPTQVKVIVKQVNALGLDHDGFAAIVKATTGINPEGQTGKDLLATLTSEQAASIIDALMNLVTQPEVPVEEDEQDDLPLV